MKLKSTKISQDHLTILTSNPLTGFQTTYQVPNGRARLGQLRINGVCLETPALFPVLNLLTGPPSLHRNGATHKFLKNQLIFKNRRAGFMSEVLHFTDYPFPPRVLRQWFPHSAGSRETKTLDYWVKQSFDTLYEAKDILEPQGDYQPLFFLDSGGFRLLFNRDVDIAEYGYQPTQESILQLQLDYGANIVASLDYPVPPMLHPVQAEERIDKSIANALKLMELLYRQGKTDPSGKRPFPILAVHGQTPSQMQHCILQLFQTLAEAGFSNEPFGLGIGSLVPLRLASNADKIVMIVRSAIETIRGEDIPVQFNALQIPVHVFGITGDMIPVLAHLGVDTFDSSSYIKSASVLDYYDATTWTSTDFRKLSALTCNCDACSGITPAQLAMLHEVLRGKRISGKTERLDLQIGEHKVNIKSDVYGIIAYHNLNLQDREISRIREAITTATTAEHLVQFSQAHARAQALTEFVAELDPFVSKALGHVQVDLFPRTLADIDQHYNTISLTNDPNAFNICTNPDYTVPADKDRLLILICTQAKPYRHSKSHSTIFRFLRMHVGNELERSHKVTLSGLYGPVPMEYEDEEAVRNYEYVLSTSAKRQSELVTSRLAAYLERHMHAYQHIVAYVTAGAYRAAVEVAFSRVRENIAQRNESAKSPSISLILVPAKTHGTGSKELFGHTNLMELLHALYPEPALRQAVPIQLQAPVNGTHE